VSREGEKGEHGETREGDEREEEGKQRVGRGGMVRRSETRQRKEWPSGMNERGRI
jgi:hypothetical protein